MKIEYNNEILFVNIYYLSSKIYMKFNVIKKMIEKHNIRKLVINLNNNNSSMKSILLSMNEFMKKRGGEIYFIK